MSKLVLDASVAIKWVLVEVGTPRANQLREDFRNQAVQLLAPDIFAAEVAHALTRAERRGILQQGESAALLADVLSTAPDLHPFLSLLPRALEISSKMRCGVYDALYVALAEQEVCDLVTSDQKMISVLGKAFPFIKPL